MPHELADRALQIVPEQHPEAQETESQTQVPPTHRCPASHGEDVPHMHAPEEEQRSAARGSQETQAEPPIPQALTSGVVQLVPAQQPVGQEVASQTHAPPAHRCPEPHGGPLPHAHAPPAHVSAVMGLHATHADAEVPQVEALAGLHVAPEQQPVGQVTELQLLHTPPVHAPPAQSSHAAPPLPHRVDSPPSSQMVPRQQPAQDSPSHTQIPAEQRCPAPHSAPRPH